MKINTLYIDKYGKFSDYNFEFSKNFVLIYGENEAGKSTLLNSIIGFLYGMNRGSRYAYKYGTKNLKIGAEIVFDSGEKHILHRRYGLKNTLLNEMQESIKNDELLLSLIGSDKYNFRNIFAMNHHDLVNGGNEILKTNGNLSINIFEAMTGILDLSFVLKNLSDKNKNLFEGRASEIKKLNKSYQELLKQRQDTVLTSTRWNEVKNEYDGLEKELLEIKTNLKEKRKKLSLLDRSIGNIHLFSIEKEKKSNIEKLRDKLPIVIYENRGFQEEFEEFTRLINEMTEAELKLGNLTKNSDNIVINNDILSKKIIIEKLANKIELFKKEQLTLEKLFGEKKKLEHSIENYKQSLGNIKTKSINKTIVETLGAHVKEFTELKNELEIFEKSKLQLNSKVSSLDITLNMIGEISDIDKYQELVDKITKEQLSDKRKSEYRSKIKDVKDHIELRTLSLPFINSSEEILQLKLPLKETIIAFVKEIEKLETKIISSDSILEEYKSEQKILNIKYEKLKGSKNFTIEALRIMQNKLEILWNEVAKSVQSEEVNDYKLKILEFDTDFKEFLVKNNILFEELEEYIELKVIEDNIKKNDELIKVEVEKNEQLREKLDLVKNEWREKIKDFKIIGLAPNETMELKKLQEELMPSFENLIKIENEFENYSKIVSNVMNNAVKLDEKFVSAESIDGIYNLIQEEIKKVTERNHKIKNLRENREDLKNELSEIEESCKKVLLQIDAKKSSIREFSKKIELEDTFDEIYIKKSISILFDYINMIEKLDNIEISIDESKNVTNSFIKLFEELTGNLPEKDFEEKVFYYSNLLRKNYEVAAVKENLEKEINLEKEKFNQLNEMISDKRSYLSRTTSNIDFNHINEKNISVLKEINVLEDELKKIHKTFYDNNIGKDIEKIRNEIEKYEIDDLNIEIEIMKNEVRNLEKISNEIEQKYGIAKRNFDVLSMGKNDEINEIETQIQEIIIQLKEKIYDYFVCKIGASTLKKSMEKVRKKNQNPIINKTSELFCHITDNVFKGVRINYDETDEPILQGIRSNEELLSVEEMSEGTRDQLFLAIRCAVMFYRIENKEETVPILFDDVFINFDNNRTVKAFEILERLSDNSQVIYFTHDKLLKDEIEKRFQNVQIINLEKQVKNEI